MDSTREDEKIRFLDINKWHYKILNSPVYLFELSGYVEQKDLVSEYINRRELPNEEKATYIEFIEVDLEIAVKILSRQMIVLAATYIEGIIFEFLKLIFTKHPERMYEYLGQNTPYKGGGKVTLHEIVHASSKVDLINQLSTRAAQQATRGGFYAIRKRIKKISDCNLNKVLCEIIELRNKIVHEAIEPDISEDEVLDAFKNLEKMLFEIGIKAVKNGIEIKDDDNFLSEEPPF